MTESVSGSRLVVLCGVDGCGKSTLSRSMQADLNVRNIANRIVWSRFRNYLSKPLLAVTRVTGHNSRFQADGEWLAYHDFSGIPVYREIFALLQAIDVNIGAYLHITRARARCNGITICERGPWDTLVDVIADTGLDGMIGSVIADLYVRQLADAALIVLVQRDLDAIFSVRPALRHDPTIARRNELYCRIAAREGWFVLDNNRPLDCTREALREAVADAHCFEKAGENVA